ncbi:MAG: LacI family DNA-binding transcriptional regulator [Oscillospiraceae bacterium]|nr:LacI family DNA-binding transcriptional regulator [Oscillospiraceae bacterium]
MKKGTRMIDIAESLNISVVTVSNALNNRGGVSPELREMIKKMADEIGYQYDNSSKNGSKSESVTIGILYSDSAIGGNDNMVWQMCQKISEEFVKVNSFVITENVSKNMISEAILPRLITENKVSGVIILGNLPKLYITEIKDYGLPMLMVECESENKDSIMVDKYNSGFMLADYLYSKGHRKIGFVGEISSDDNVCDLYLGYLKAILRYNLEKNETWLLSDKDSSGLMKRKFDIDLKTLPTAFVCSRDESAFRLAASLKASGINVPGDVSIVSFGNSFAAEMSDPPITSVGVDADNISRIASEMMVKKLNDESVSYGTSYIAGIIKERESVSEI